MVSDFNHMKSFGKADSDQFCIEFGHKRKCP